MNADKPKKPAAPTVADPPKSIQLHFKLNSKNVRLLLLGCLVLSAFLFLAILSFGLSSLGSQSKKMVDLKVQTKTADAQLANLEKAKKQVQQYSYFKDVTKTVIPNDKNQAEDILEINRIAEAAGISIQSITFPASTLGLTTSSVAQDATSSSSTKAAISQAKPVSGIAGLYSLELTITPETNTTAPPNKQLTYAKMLDFLKRIENNRHTAQITSVVITPSGSGNSVVSAGFSFVLTINIFIKP